MPPSNPSLKASSSPSTDKVDFSPLEDITSTLLPSLEFKKWLQLTTELKLSSHDTRARRFRRGNDYSLAMAFEDDNPRLELTLGIMPTGGWVGTAISNFKSRKQSRRIIWACSNYAFWIYWVPCTTCEGVSSSSSKGGSCLSLE